MANCTSHLYIDTKTRQLSSIYHHLLYGHEKNSWRDVFAALKSLKNFPHSLIQYYDPFKTRPDPCKEEGMAKQIGGQMDMPEKLKGVLTTALALLGDRWKPRPKDEYLWQKHKWAQSSSQQAEMKVD